MSIRLIGFVMQVRSSESTGEEVVSHDIECLGFPLCGFGACRFQ
jgi:hypothetical protein